MEHFNRFIRQDDLVDYNILKTPIYMIGAGGIGSFATLTLAKMGFTNILVIDNDTIEEHNLPNQFFPIDSIGKPKVDALHTVIKNFTGVEIHSINGIWDKETMVIEDCIVVLAVDNMLTRADLYAKYARSNKIKGIIDGRMGGQQAEVYTINLRKITDRKIYAKTLWNENETADIPCTAKAVIYNVLWIASTISNHVRLLLSDLPYNVINIMDFQNNIIVQPKEL